MKNWQFYLVLAFMLVYTASIVPVFKITLQHVSAEEFTLFVYSFSAIVFLIAIALRNKLDLIKENISSIHKFIFLGVVGLALNRLFYLNSFHMIQATEANILYYTYPLTIGILGVLILREKMRPIDLVGLLLGFIGAAVVITKLDFGSGLFSTSLFGDLLAIAGGTCYAIYLIFSKKWKIDSMVLVFFCSMAAAITAGAYILLFSRLVMPPLIGLAGMTYVAIADTILIIIFIELLRMKNTFKIANAFYAIPFIAAILNYFILKETIHISYIIGLVLLTIGVFLQNKNNRAT